jgi:hypothetical protein
LKSTPILHLLIFTVFSACFLAACQERDEEPHTVLKPTKSHRNIKEKAVVVPPEVLRHWRAVKLVVIDKTRGTENIYDIPIGSTLTIPSSALAITVEAFLPAFTMEGPTITTSSNELVNPGAKVRIVENGVPVFQGWLFSKFPNTHAVTHPKYGFSFMDVVPVSK